MKKLIIMSGLPLSGKTYISKNLSKELDYIHIDVDEIKKLLNLYNDNINNKNEKDIMILCYDSMIYIAKEILLNNNLNNSVIISGTFSKFEFKEKLYDLLFLLKNNKILYYIFMLECNDDNEIKRRIKLRNKENLLSNINTFEKYEWSKTIFNKIKSNVIILNSQNKNIIKNIKDYINDENNNLGC